MKKYFFEFVQHNGLTFHQVLMDAPGYYVWARKEKLPRKKLKEFLTWVSGHYAVTSSDGEHAVTLLSDGVLAPPGPHDVPRRFVILTTWPWL